MPDPMWKQIAENLRHKIESGELGSDGKPLPTELELQADYSASRNTVRDAIKWLAGRNLVYTRSGQGTFVAPKVDPFVTKLSTHSTHISDTDTAAYASEVTSRRRHPDASPPRVEIQQAAGLVVSELQLPTGASVVCRHQQRFIDGLPYSLQTTFYPMQLVERGATRLIQAEDITQGAVGYIRDKLHIEEAGLRDRIVVRVPDPTEAAFFGLPDDGRIAVIEIVRTGYDKSGKPFRVTVTTYPADRNQFEMITGDVPDTDQMSRDVAAGNSESRGSQG